MAHVGRQPRKSRVKVNPGAVPVGQAMHCECVAKVVWPRPLPTESWFEASQTKQPDHSEGRAFDRKRITVAVHEEAGAGSNERES